MAGLSKNMCGLSYQRNNKNVGSIRRKMYIKRGIGITTLIV